ncbi:MAG TPA: hypothetical protein V6D08_11275 [Candidatus Obscuribacterales bacterium]
MSEDGIKPWFDRQLALTADLLSPVGPGVLIWSSLAVSILAGAFLGLCADRPWLAAAAIPLLMARLLLGPLSHRVALSTSKAGASFELMTEMSDRMADIALFLGLTFSPLVDKVLGLLAIICILMVSFVGVLGKAVGTERIRAGILGRNERMMFLMVACLAWSLVPQFDFRGYTVFGILLLLFIPLASLTLLQRLDRILSLLAGKSR